MDSININELIIKIEIFFKSLINFKLEKLYS